MSPGHDIRRPILCIPVLAYPDMAGAAVPKIRTFLLAIGLVAANATLVAGQELQAVEVHYRPLFYAEGSNVVGCGTHFSIVTDAPLLLQGSINAFYSPGRRPAAIMALTVVGTGEQPSVLPLSFGWVKTPNYGMTQDFEALPIEGPGTYLAVNTTNPGALFLPIELHAGFSVGFVLHGQSAGRMVRVPQSGEARMIAQLDGCLRSLFRRIETDRAW